MRTCTVLALVVLVGASSARADTTAGKVPVSTSVTVVGSCNVGGVIGNSPQTQSVQIGPFTWNYQGRTLTPSAPIVQTIDVTCSRGEAATVTIPPQPADGFVAPSSKNGQSMPFVLWVAASAVAFCASPLSTAQLTQTSTSSTQPIRFYIAACANPKKTQQGSGDYTTTLSAALRY